MRVVIVTVLDLGSRVSNVSPLLHPGSCFQIASEEDEAKITAAKTLLPAVTCRTFNELATR